MRYSKEQIRKAMLLYAVTDRSWLKENETLLDVVKEVVKNGATFLQIREKDLNGADFEAEAKTLQDICREHQVPYVVNDNVEIAMKIHADGVHVGQSDIKSGYPGNDWFGQNPWYFSRNRRRSSCSRAGGS